MTLYDKNNPSTIRALFDSIAPRYDLGNAVLSGNLHRLWNRRLANRVLSHNPHDILDLCCGTGDITKRMMRYKADCSYHLVDFSQQMLDIAKKTVTGTNVQFYQADAEELPFKDSMFDAVSVAYGIRNIQNRAKCFSELYRVLKPGGRMCIAELTRPKGAFLNTLHRFYLRTMVPLVGRVITSNEEAYTYLCNSIESFISPEQLIQEQLEAGFSSIEVKPQTFGIATLFFSQKL